MIRIHRHDRKTVLSTKQMTISTAIHCLVTNIIISTTCDTVVAFSRTSMLVTVLVGQTLSTDVHCPSSRQVVNRMSPRVDGIVDDYVITTVKGSVSGHYSRRLGAITSGRDTLTDGGNVVSGHRVGHPKEGKVTLVEDDGRLVAILLPLASTAKVPDREEENDECDEADEGSIKVGLLHGVGKVVATGLRRMVHLKVILTDALVV